MPTGRTSPSDPKDAARSGGSRSGSERSESSSRSGSGKSESSGRSGSGRTSAADLAQGLKGADFPMNKDELVEQARDNGAAEEIIQAIQQMPDQDFQSMADVERAFGQSNS
jgi:hypothetical protein